MSPTLLPSGFTPRQSSGGRPRLFAFLAVCALFVAACGSDSEDTEEATVAEAVEAAEPAAAPEETSGEASESVETQSVSMQLSWIKNMQFPGPYMATEQGYYDEYGLDVELLGGGPSVDSITVVASGASIIGMADSNEIAVARGQGIPVVALGAAFLKSPFGMITLADAPIDTLEGMYGMTVAVSDGSRPTIEALMEREGLDPSQVDFVPKNPDPSVLPDGAVDAYWGFVSSEGAVLKARGVDVVWTLLSDLGEPTYANTYFTMQETLEENRDLIVSIMAADLAGWQYSVDNVEDTVRITQADYQDEDAEYEIMLEQHRAQIDLISPDGVLLTMDPAVFEANIESAIAGGLLDEAISVDEVVDFSVLEDARALAGK
ncbi:MAG: ABC-type nitrate/sulfonate/bicarbonate transport system substrate-binding protein [Ilumatobacter sp.]|jgi:ABC-type nitrate/sulfonate/bicarbonate transport system substrate-binding protein